MKVILTTSTYKSVCEGKENVALIINDKNEFETLITIAKKNKMELIISFDDEE